MVPQTNIKMLGITHTWKINFRKETKMKKRKKEGKIK